MSDRPKPTPEQEEAFRDVLDGKREAHVIAHTAAIDRRPWWRSMWCWLAHSRFGRWNEQGDICCARCNVIVWTGAAFSLDYERIYGPAR